MINVLLGILIGAFLPIQTTINGRLKVAIESPFKASQISALVTLFVLLVILGVNGEGYYIPLGMMVHDAPWWIWTGGVLGATVIMGGITVFVKLGAVQSAILPVAGQILMGIIIDQFALFEAPQQSMTIARIVGAALVFVGVLIITKARFDVPGDDGSKPKSILIYQIIGVAIGVANAMQTAINAHMKLFTGSPLKATLVNNVICNIAITVISLAVIMAGAEKSKRVKIQKPWWMWTGGIFGMGIVAGNVIMALRVGPGYAILILLIGTTIGGVLIDHFGLFEAPQKKITKQKFIGIILMLIGCALFRLL